MSGKRGQSCSISSVNHAVYVKGLLCGTTIPYTILMDFTTFTQLARWCKQAVSQDRLHLAILSKPLPGSPDMHGFKKVYDFWRAHQPGIAEGCTRSDRLPQDQAHLDSFLGEQDTRMLLKINTQY